MHMHTPASPSPSQKTQEPAFPSAGANNAAHAHTDTRLAHTLCPLHPFSSPATEPRSHKLTPTPVPSHLGDAWSRPAQCQARKEC
eukprot:1160335-Pelagomonas_calceolata.AAC.15